MSMRTETSSSAELKTKIENRQAQVASNRPGYVGLPLARFSASRSCESRASTSTAKVDTLERWWVLHFSHSRGRNRSCQDQWLYGDRGLLADLTEMDAVIICVPTPLNEYHEPDLSYITNTGNAIAPHLRAGQLVILESTTYPGYDRRSSGSDSREGK